MIILKYWREILIALILAAVGFLGWHLKSVIDQRDKLASQVQQDVAQRVQMQRAYDDLAKEKKLADDLVLKQATQRQTIVIERKKNDATFRKAEDTQPAVKAWADSTLPAAALDELRQSAGSDENGKDVATAGPAR